MIPLVIDTNLLVAALQKDGGPAREILRRCLSGHYLPLIGTALFLEYEEVLGRNELFQRSPLNVDERGEVFKGFLAVCRWTEVFYAWRPNLPDEGDNHLIELAVAGCANAIVTRNLRDIACGELRFPTIAVISPEHCLEVYPCPR